MSKPQKRQLTPRKHFDREMMLLRYTVALDRGDLETIAAMLQIAETDAEFEQMILEINDVYAAEIEEAAYAQDAAVVRELLHTHLLFALPESATEPPPLTVGHIIARIHANAAQNGRVEREVLAATRHHQTNDIPLPNDLSVRGVNHLLQQLGIEAGRRFQDLFRQTAILMRMGRNQGMARLAATRRQQQVRSKPKTTSNSEPADSMTSGNSVNEDTE